MLDQANVADTKHKLLTETSKGKRLGKSIPQLSLEQIYPAPNGDVNLNTCGDPDCGYYGVAPDSIHSAFRSRNAGQRRLAASLKNSGINMGVGRYRLHGGKDDKKIRNSIALEYADDPHSWDDNRSVKCQHTARNSECGIQFKVLSNEHFAKEEERFLSQNGLLDGPRCGHCGTTYLSAPEEFFQWGKRQENDRQRQIKGHRCAYDQQALQGQNGRAFHGLSISYPATGPAREYPNSQTPG